MAKYSFKTRTLTVTREEALKMAKVTIAPETGDMLRAVAVNVAPGEEIEISGLRGLAFLHIMEATKRARIEL